jgi:hypothetical protein
MTTSTILVSFSIHGQQGISDVEIPDDRGLFETATLLIDAIQLADMRANRIKQLEIIEPTSVHPKVLASSQTALSADVRDGAWIIAHLERVHAVGVQPAPSAVTTFAVGTQTVAPTPSTGSQSISFQRRVVSDGSTLTREETNS